MVTDDPISVLNERTKRQAGLSYRLTEDGDRYGMDIAFCDVPVFDTARMSMVIPFADGNRRDGVGDLLEIGGIKTDRHIRNAVCLFDHGKQPSAPVLPIAMAWERDEAGKYDKSKYTVDLDVIAKTGKANAFFYQGKDLIAAGEDGEQDLFARTDKSRKYDHAVLCEQYYHMAVTGLLQGGSIGYQVIKAMELSPDYQTGTPQGLHLLVTLMLECSLVVMPANQDTVLKVLAMPRMCGKALSPCLVKSLSAYATEQTKTVVGFAKALDLKSIRKRYKAQVDDPAATEFTSGRISGGRKLPGVDYVFKPGDRVTARTYISGKDGRTFVNPGDKIVIVEVTEPHSRFLGQNMAGDYQEVFFNKVRKHLETKPIEDGVKSLDFKSVRKLYRTAKGMRRRLKRSSPGMSVMHVAEKDIKAAQEMAEQKGLKFARIGHKDGAEKVKLTGDDGSIDEVAKAFGTRVKSMGIKAVDPNASRNEIGKMYDDLVSNQKLTSQDAVAKIARQYSVRDFVIVNALTKLGKLNEGTKAMADDIEVPEDDNGTGPAAMETETPPQEPHGAQVLRRMHEDHKILMKDYHDMMGPLEHEGVKKHLEKTLQGIEGTLGETEKHFGKHYKDLPPLEGADDMGDANADSEELDSGGADAPDDEDTTEATSGEQDLPTPEEAAEGSQKDPEDGKKHLKTGKAKTVTGKRKSMCPKCKSPNCKCGKALTQDEAGKIEGELATQTEDTEKNPAPHEMKMISAAAQHCKDLSQTQDFSDMHRMDAHHHAKNLDDIAGGGSDPNPDPGTEGPPVAGPGTAGPEEKFLDNAPTLNVGGVAGTMGGDDKGWHKSLSEASRFLHGVSQEKAFGDAHRQEAGYHGGQLESIASKAMPDETAQEDQDETHAGEDGVKPGDLGEKNLEKEWDEGYAAAQAGKPVTANPYRMTNHPSNPSNEQHVSWEHGWKACPPGERGMVKSHKALKTVFLTQQKQIAAQQQQTSELCRVLETLTKL